jgi:hypothetical protein
MRLSTNPAYRERKPSGQARVIVNGRHVYLGKYGSEESKQKRCGPSPKPSLTL